MHGPRLAIPPHAVTRAPELRGPHGAASTQWAHTWPCIVCSLDMRQLLSVLEAIMTTIFLGGCTNVSKLSWLQFWESSSIAFL